MIWSKDVTIAPRGKVELWLCQEVQEPVKKVITWCIDNLLKVTKVGYTKKVYKKKLHKGFLPSLTEWRVGVEKSQYKSSEKLVGVK